MNEQGHRIRIATDFSRFPAGRLQSDGPYSGEACRRRLLVPALRRGAKLIVDLDGTLGYGSSFLEEAFGGLVRVEGFSPDQLRELLTIVGSDSSLVTEIWSYIDGGLEDGRARQVG